MSLELSKPPCSGVSSGPRLQLHTMRKTQKVFSLECLPGGPSHCEMIEQVEYPHVGSEQAPCMRKLVYRCTVGSLRITAPVPRTWIPVRRDMPQIPTAGIPAATGTVHAVPRSIARVANRTKVVWWGWAIAVQPASSRSYQLVDVLSHGTVSSSSSRGLRGRGARGRPAGNLPQCLQPPTPPCGRSTFLSPERGRQITSCGCLPQPWECWGRPMDNKTIPRAHMCDMYCLRSFKGNQAGHISSVKILVRLASSRGC